MAPAAGLPVTGVPWGPDLRLPALLAAEQRVSRWAVLGAAAYGAGLAVVTLIDLAQASAWQRYFHAVHVFFQQAGTPGYVNQVFPQAPRGNDVGLVFLLPGIMFLVWQFRAAEVGRALGYPARHGPGWGIGAWFVPVVNLWVPYGAMRDCLPPGHPARRWGWLPWVLYLAGGILQLGVIVAGAEVRSLGIALVVVTLMVDLYVFGRAFRFVHAVHEDHRRACQAVVEAYGPESGGGWR